ncbi:MAG: U32 family peptidase [Ruminiclostridium sp.]|nr:U32 family peptidase [Ruminiclostridium sp.]
MNLRAEVYTRKQLGEALENPNIEMVYAPYSIVDESLSEYSERIILVPPVFLADCEESVVKRCCELKKVGFNNILVHTIGHIELFRDFSLFGGYRLNCVNSDSIDFYSENNVADIIISPELTAYQINKLSTDSNIGFIAYGHLPLMITRRCPIKNGKPCNKEYCKRFITDRKGNKSAVICNENTAEILNSDVLYLGDKLDSFNSVSFAVLKFTVEDSITPIIISYKKNELSDNKGFTRGLYFRGVVN